MHNLMSLNMCNQNYLVMNNSEIPNFMSIFSALFSERIEQRIIYCWQPKTNISLILIQMIW